MQEKLKKKRWKTINYYRYCVATPINSRGRWKDKLGGLVCRNALVKQFSSSWEGNNTLLKKVLVRLTPHLAALSTWQHMKANPHIPKGPLGSVTSGCCGVLRPWSCNQTADRSAPRTALTHVGRNLTCGRSSPDSEWEGPWGRAGTDLYVDASVTLFVLQMNRKLCLQKFWKLPESDWGEGVSSRVLTFLFDRF